ncbi:MFS transporter [Nocardia alni]|uniref:MFS transporter n=1 Tax=Nocardia alni TaxID=2815723 RepID=UPI001C2394D6|nr:MFS transporter [Nocardia alni]
MAIEELTRSADQGPSGRRAWIGVDHPRYKWVALTNTTLGILLATVNASIVLISLPGIFNGIHLDPLQASNISYLLWVLMGYMLVTAVLVVAFGRLGDMWGRVRIYNAGFAIFTITSVILSLDPAHGAAGALWLIGWRLVQAVGGSMLMANSAAILTDAFPVTQRGMALGVNMVAGIAGSFVGLILGGVLVSWDWRAVFWVNVPIGIIGTVWAYRSLHETGIRTSGRMDWWGNLTFAVGLTALLAAITYGIQPYGGHTMGWTDPWVLAGLIGGVLILILFCVVELRIAEPMFPLGLFRNALFAGGNGATLLGAIARGGMQFMLIIWLQGIWLPLHGFDYADTPLWAGIYLLPLTIGFLVAGPIAGYLSDRFGARLFAAAGFVVMAAAFAGMLVLPTDFNYWVFALLIFVNGLGSGLFAAPNTAIIMSSVPAAARGAASGMRATFQNAGMVLSMGLFFSLMIAGLAGSMPHTLFSGLTQQGVPAQAASTIAGLPPVGVLFAAFLGYNPIAHLLGPQILGQLPAANSATLTGRQFFPHLIAQPFHNGLVVVFSMAIGLSVVAALASLIRGRTKDLGVLDAEVSADAVAGLDTLQGIALPVETDSTDALVTRPAQSAAPVVTGRTAPLRLPFDEITRGAMTTSGDEGGRTSGIGGYVADSAGRPVPGATLTLIDHGGHQHGRARSRTDGAYDLLLPPPGRYVVIVAAEDYKPHATALTVNGRRVVHDVVLSGGTALSGRVTAPDGEPVTTATLVVTEIRGEVVGAAASGADGKYMVPNLFPGLFTVTASAPGFRPVAVTATIGPDDPTGCDLVLPHAARIDGVVRHNRTDNPIPGARITLLAGDGTVVANAVADDTGTYALTDLVPGDYTLCASGYPPVSGTVTIDGLREPYLDLHFDTPTNPVA